MKKIKFGIVEILGYIGMLVWIGIIFLRESAITGNEIYVFFRGILPNLGAAWAMTMFGKWILVLVIKKEINVKIHFFLCFGIFVLGFLSEIIHDVYLNSPFDIYDIFITTAAQVVMFLAPILMKDKYFKGYN